jgi:hypothetical protein
MIRRIRTMTIPMLAFLALGPMLGCASTRSVSPGPQGSGATLTKAEQQAMTLNEVLRILKTCYGSSRPETSALQIASAARATTLPKRR